MRKFLSSLLIVITTISLTFSSNALQIDEKINEILNPISVIVVSIVFFSVEIFFEKRSISCMRSIFPKI